MSQKALSEVESKAQAVKRLADASSTGMYVLEDAADVVEPFGEEAVKSVKRRSDTFHRKGAIPGRGYDFEDEAVGAYEVAQVAIEAEGGEPLSGDGMGHGSYARSAYRKNMWRLAEMVDGVGRDELELMEPVRMDG